MAYTAPVGNEVHFYLEDGYTAPSGDAVNFTLSIETAPIKVIFIEPYLLTPTVVGTINEYYGIKLGTAVIESCFLPTYLATRWTEQYGAPLLTTFIEPYIDVPVITSLFYEYYGDAQEPLRRYILPYGDGGQVSNSYTLPWSVYSSPLNSFIEPYATTQTGLVQSVEEPYEFAVNNAVLTVKTLPYPLLDEGSQIATSSTTVVVNSGSGDPNSSGTTGSGSSGTTLQTMDFISITIDAGMGQYCISCEVTLPNAEQYEWCNYLDEVVVTLGGTEYEFFIESRERTVSNDAVSYNIGMLSPTAKLESPYSQTLVDNLDDGTMAQALVVSMAALQNITVDWQILDWFIPGYAISINDETPLTVIKKVVNSVGAIVQTKPNGDMLIISKYPNAVPTWSTLTPTISYSTSADIISLSETLVVKDGYNAFQITDQGSSSESINLEVVDINGYSKIVKGYRVPFDDGEFPLETSGNPDVSITRYAYPVETEIPIVEEPEDPEWEIVEFIDHTGSTSLPIYEVVDYEWIVDDLGDVGDLGAFQVSEDGTLAVINTDAVPSESLLRIKYITKYWQWTVSGPTDRPVQFYVPEIEEVA